MELPASGKTGMDTGGVQGREKKYEEVEIERKEENRVEEEKSVESVEESVELPASGSYWAAVTNVKNVMDTRGFHRGEKEYEEEEIELKEENRVKEELGVEVENAVEGVELTVKLSTSGPPRITVTSIKSDTATGGVHREIEHVEEEISSGS